MTQPQFFFISFRFERKNRIILQPKIGLRRYSKGKSSYIKISDSVAACFFLQPKWPVKGDTPEPKAYLPEAMIATPKTQTQMQQGVKPSPAVSKIAKLRCFEAEMASLPNLSIGTDPINSPTKINSWQDAISRKTLNHTKHRTPKPPPNQSW